MEYAGSDNYKGGRDRCFYMYATEDTAHTPISKSKDLVTWQFVGATFSQETRTYFEPIGGLWAPDINYINGQYVFYYSMSVWGERQYLWYRSCCRSTTGRPFYG